MPYTEEGRAGTGEWGNPRPGKSGPEAHPKVTQRGKFEHGYGPMRSRDLIQLGPILALLPGKGFARHAPITLARS